MLLSEWHLALERGAVYLSSESKRSSRLSNPLFLSQPDRLVIRITAALTAFHSRDPRCFARNQSSSNRSVSLDAFSRCESTGPRFGCSV